MKFNFNLFNKKKKKMQINLTDFNVHMLDIYNSNEKELERLFDDLNYYFLECKDLNKRIYITPNNLDEFKNTKRINIIYKIDDHGWDNEKLDFLVETSLKKSLYLLLGLKTYHGRMSSNFWEKLRIYSSEYFMDTVKFRSNLLNNKPNLNKGENKQDNLNIDDILNKINENGIDSLTEEERKFLNNKK